MGQTVQFLRHFNIDNYTIGYNYPKKSFYITYEDTTTYREDFQNFLNVVSALQIESPVSEELQERILECKTREETIGDTSSLYHTWHDTGLYIQSIQFNEWSDYKLCIDCNKGILYIDNSTTIFDLRANESLEIVIAPLLRSYYKDTLGLFITQEQMLGVCNFLIYFYKPTCINTMTTIESNNNKELYYTNTFKLTNFSGTSRAEYTCTNNPNNQFTDAIIGHITSMNSNTSTITLTEPLSEETIEEYDLLKEGTKLKVQGSITTIDDETYTNDGEYTITSIEGDTIKVQESMPVSYDFPYLNCSVKAYTYQILEISRDNSSIKLNETPDNILIGDKITLTGCNINTEFEVIQVNGIYTVRDIIEENTLIVEEEIATNHAYTESAYATKEVYIGEIASIDFNNKKFKLLEPTEFNLKNNVIMVYNSSIESSNTYTVTNNTTNNDTIVVQETIKEETNYPNYPNLIYLEPLKDILIDITYTEKGNEDILPEGEFIVNNYINADRYIKLLNGIVSPSDMAKNYEESGNLYPRNIESNLYRKVEDTLEIPIIVIGDNNYYIESMLSLNDNISE